MMDIDEYHARFGLSGALEGLGNNPNLGLGNDLSIGLGNLFIDDFSTDWGNNLGNNYAFELPGGESSQFGFNEDFVQLPFLGGWQQGFGGLEDTEFGPELAPEFLQNFRTYPIDPEVKQRKHRRRHKRDKSDKRRDGPAPRADGPGFYESPHYDHNHGSLPASEPSQAHGSLQPEAPAQPPVSSSVASSRSGVRGPEAGGPSDADEVASNSSHSSHSSASSASSASSQSSSGATPVPPAPKRPQERGRPTEKKATPEAPRRDYHTHDQPPQKPRHRRRSPDDLLRVERARGISPNRNPPSYDTYERFYRRTRSPSPGESITTRSSSADSSSYHGSTAGKKSSDEPIRKSKLFKAASKCTADYLTRLKIHAPSSRWVKTISDIFYRMGFTIVDCVFEETEGIVTILAPPELVAREIERLPLDIQSAVVSIRAARVCRKNGEYDLQVW